MANRAQGSNINYERVSGELFFKPTGQTGIINLGNVVGHKLVPEIQRKEHKKAERGGLLTRDREDVIESTLIYELELDEHFLETEEILLFGAAGSNNVQASGTDATAQFTAAKRRWFSVGKRRISNVVVEVATVAKTLNTDYKVDAERGLIYIVEGGSIADAATVDVTFDHAADTVTTITAMSDLAKTGTITIVESDQESNPIRKTVEFTGQLIPINWGDQKNEDFNKYSLRAQCNDNDSISIQMRQS